MADPTRSKIRHRYKEIWFGDRTDIYEIANRRAKALGYRSVGQVFRDMIPAIAKALTSAVAGGLRRNNITIEVSIKRKEPDK